MIDPVFIRFCFDFFVRCSNFVATFLGVLLAKKKSPHRDMRAVVVDLVLYAARPMS